ncbi:MAG: DUF3794 domain-containing protein [Clostridia bacterium]|nr:DUF3794 domain-containing protein [Clostridia bacterium]
MEQNILKSSIKTQEIVFKETVEQSIDTDYTLPDYCKDIERVLKCKAVPRVSLKAIDGNKVTIDGNVHITVYYCDEEGQVNSYYQNYPFEKVKDLEKEMADAVLEVVPKCEYINCRAVTNRKIDIHGAVALKISVKQNKTTEIISDIDDAQIEILRGTAPATTPTGFAEKYLIIEEDTEISSEKNAQKILGFDAESYVRETKIISGKALVKGEMNIKIKYFAEGNINCFNTSIPFSQVLDIETVGDTCDVTAKSCVAFLEITPKTDSNGNFNICFINAKILISAKTYCNNDIAVIFDAYSRKTKSEISRDNVEFLKIYKRLFETFSCKKSINVESGSISAVLDNWCDVVITDSGFFDDSLVVSGTVTASFLIADKDGLASYFEKTIDFSYKYPVENSKNKKCDPSVMISSCGYTITSNDSLEVRAQITVSGDIYESSQLPVVTKVENGEAPKEKQDCAMVVYFAKKDEKIWDIAKKYLSSMEEIKSINGLENEYFTEDTAVLIPM